MESPWYGRQPLPVSASPRFLTSSLLWFVKCKMDVGVGSFVVSSGLVAGIGYRRTETTGSSSSSSSLSSKLLHLLPLLGAAMIRLVSVKASDYQVPFDSCP